MPCGKQHHFTRCCRNCLAPGSLFPLLFPFFRMEIFNPIYLIFRRTEAPMEGRKYPVTGSGGDLCIVTVMQYALDCLS